MTVKKTDKDQLLDNASLLFCLKGYHNTSISDIAAACNLSKGSVYHYITSKKELGIAVIKRAHRIFNEKIFSIADQYPNSPKEGFKAFLDGIYDYFNTSKVSFLINNLVHEVSDTIPEFADLFQVFYKDWINAIAKLYSNQTDETKRRELAEDTLCQIQGAIMMMNLFNDKAFLERVGRNVIDSL